MQGKTRLEIGTKLFSQIKPVYLLHLEKQRFGKEGEKKIYFRGRKHYPKKFMFGDVLVQKDLVELSCLEKT